METLILILAILVIIESINIISVYSYVKYLRERGQQKFYDLPKVYYMPEE